MFALRRMEAWGLAPYANALEDTNMIQAITVTKIEAAFIGCPTRSD